MRIAPSMFWTLKVTLESTSNLWSTMSSKGSTARAGATKRTHPTNATQEARRLLIAQRYHGIDFHGAPRGNVTRQSGRDYHQADYGGVSDDVGRLDSVKHAGEQT